MVSTMPSLAHRLREARLSMGYTVERVADAIDTSTTSIWRYESGQRRPSGPTLHALATLYDKSVAWLQGEDVEEIPAPSDPDLEADRELLMNEVDLAFRQVAPELSDEAIRAIAAFIRFTHTEEERERREREGGSL